MLSLFGYLMIGLLIACILQQFDCGEAMFILTVLLWPGELILLIVLSIIAIPVVIGTWIGQMIKRLL